MSAATQRYTSRTFEFRRRLMERFAAVVWPPLAGMDPPHIGWHESRAEWVMVERVAGTLAHVAQGPTMRDETITATIVLLSEVPGFTEEQACARMEELADVVQRMFFASDGPFPEPVGFDLSGEYLSAAIERVETFPYRAPEGFGARCEIDVSVDADICQHV